MYSEWVLPGILAAVFIWLGVLSFLVWKQGNFLKSLFPKSQERDIRIKFEELLKTVDQSEQSLNVLYNNLLNLSDRTLKHIQKVEILRYNPFDDTGGNISFSLALLDGEGCGIVLTSLHARSGTRVFAKPIKNGKAQNIKLSKEEEIVIEKAMKE